MISVASKSFTDFIILKGDNMVIRLGKSNEKDELKYLWQEVFDEDDFYLEYKFDKSFSANQSIVVVDKKIIGAAHYDILFIDNKKVAYINGVSIKKEHRGKNLSVRMLDYLHKHLLNEGFAYCFLKPAISNYYEKFGYKTVINAQKADLTYKEVSPYSVTNYGYIEIFETMCKKHSIFLPRSEKRFEKIIRLYTNYDGGIICFEREKELLGYALYAKENEKIVIEESVFLNDNGFDIMGNYFGNASVNELAVMIKDLNEQFIYTDAFIKVV